MMENEFVPRLWAMEKIDYWIAYMSVYGEDQEIYRYDYRTFT